MALPKEQRWIVRFRGDTVYLAKPVVHGFISTERSDVSRIMDFCRGKWGHGRLVVEREQTLLGDVSMYRWLLQGEEWDYDPHEDI